jgi:hypothetical protein
LIAVQASSSTWPQTHDARETAHQLSLIKIHFCATIMLTPPFRVAAR